MADPKLLLADLQKELQGEVIEEVYQVGNHKYTMRLLNEAETSWVYSHLEMGSEVGMAMSVRLPQLAAGIRCVDGVSKEELLEEFFTRLPDAQKMLMMAGGNSKRIAFYNGKFLDIIAEWNPKVVQELYTKWLELETRRSEAQVELKNS
jgi:hypothetical protein